MLNQFAVDYPTFPVNQRYSHLFEILAGTLSRSMGMLSRNDKPPDIGGLAWKIGNFFANPPASSSSLYPGGVNPWISNVTEHITPDVTSERQNQTQPWIRDASQDRQPEIHSTLMREDFQKNMEQTNKDCRFRISTLTNSLHQQHLLVGRQGSRPRYVLVHDFLRKLCFGSKKWRRWLNQWMMSNLRVLSEERLIQTLSCSTRELLQQSSRINASRKKSVWKK